MEPSTTPAFNAAAIERPHTSLLNYYLIVSLMTLPLLPAFPVVLLVHIFKYQTLRYRFDADGIFMAWGVLFRREINVTYRRIQDIHVTRNIIQRWMGLATVSIQTASGSSTPEMSIEGVLNYDGLRDFLYSRMRGIRPEPHDAHTAPAATNENNEALTLLTEIRGELSLIRAALGRPEDRR